MTHSIAIPYDSEMKIVHEQVMPKLEAMRGQRLNPQDFVDRAKDLFRQKAGLVVDVKAYTTGGVERQGDEVKVEEIPELITFEIEILGRVERHEFDHDRMRHEVVHNLLEIPGEGGEIKMAPSDWRMISELERRHRH
jgi:hypothetical protein